MRGIHMWRWMSVLGLVALTSCLELEQSIVIRADGSGTQKLTLGMTERVIAAVDRSTPAAIPLSAADPLAVFDRALVDQELRQSGMLLRSHRTWNERRREFVEFEAEFPSFEALRKSPFVGSNAEWVVQPGKGRWQGKTRLIFYPQGRAAWQQARQKAEKLEREGDGMAASLFARRQQEMEGLLVTLNIEVPGDIVWAHNMKKVGPRKATARHTDADVKSPEGLTRMLAPRYEVIFDPRGTSW